MLISSKVQSPHPAILTTALVDLSSSLPASGSDELSSYVSYRTGACYHEVSSVILARSLTQGNKQRLLRGEALAVASKLAILSRLEP